jgi:xanthine dehydrogenase YagR molybdenum-binding subunit
MSTKSAAPIVGQEQTPTSGMGAPLPRPDGRAKVTGLARYAGEEVVPNTLHVVMVTSSIARGRVVEVRSTDALAQPRVVAVLTHEQMPKLSPPPVPPVAESLIPMQSAEIHYEGQPVALVLAESLEAAEEGAARVQVVYERASPRTFDTGVARLPRTEKNGYVFQDIDTGEGDVEGSFARAATAMDATYVTPTRHHNAMEPSMTFAEWRGDALHLHDATQWTYGVRYGLSAMFGVPAEKIHVRCPYTGGAFGAKGYVWPHQILAAAAARVAGRPVKLCLGRSGCYTGSGYAPTVRSRVRLGAGSDGKLTGILHETANVTSVGDDYVEYGSGGTRSLYAAPVIATRTRVVSANVGTPTAMRAPHEGPGIFALESAMDELAYALSMDPLELRIRNHADVDPHTRKPFSSKKLREVYAEAARRFGWAQRAPRPRAMQRDGKLVGWGMASAIMSTFRIPAKARVRLGADGRVRIEAGCQEIGTGTYTIFPQVAAEVLGIPAERIELRLGDTSLPETGGTFGSSTTSCVGSAVVDAATNLKLRLATLLGTKRLPAPSEWGGLLASRGVSELVAEGAYTLPGGLLFEAHGSGSPYAMYTWGAVFVEMEVDEALGVARMTRCVAGYSAGRILNPRTARSQMIGGIILGYGRAMLEESVVDARYGRYLSKNLSGVMLPVNADIPGDIEVFFVDEHDPHVSSLGVRGIGELGEVGVAAAITNAIYHATGKRIRKLPVHIGDLIST